MDAQGRSRFIIGGLTLAAVILVISLLLTQQSARLPVVLSPLTNYTSATSPANADNLDAENVEGAAGKTTTVEQDESSLAAPIAESPLADPGNGASAASGMLSITPTLASTETVVIAASALISEAALITEAVPLTPPVALTATSTVTVSLVPPQPLRYSYEILATYPHDPEAYTQGLQYVDGMLYEGTGLYGRSSLRRVDLETGIVEQQINLDDQFFGEGIYVLDDQIYQLTWKSNVAFLYERETFEIVDQYSYPTEGWGLTYDGKDLIMSDGSSTIFRRDPASFDEVGRIQVQIVNEPVNLLNELEYINNAIWANIWLTDDVIIIDPSSGQVIAQVDLTGLLSSEEATNAEVLNGIAYDDEADRIFVTGKFWPSLFEIKLVRR